MTMRQLVLPIMLFQFNLIPRIEWDGFFWQRFEQFTLIPFALWILLLALLQGHQCLRKCVCLSVANFNKISIKIKQPSHTKKWFWKCCLQNVGPCVWAGAIYSISYEIYTGLCCVLFCCDQFTVHVLWVRLIISFNSLAFRRFECNFRNIIVKLILMIDGWCISYMKLLSSKWHLTLLMTSQQWFRWWLGAEKAASHITWTNVEPVLCRHMASPGHNVLRNIDSNVWLNDEICPYFLAISRVCAQVWGSY